MDESHIIRTIEYWDIERRRYPQYEHGAVLVAENVTSRFLNVVSLDQRASAQRDQGQALRDIGQALGRQGAALERQGQVLAELLRRGA